MQSAHVLDADDRSFDEQVIARSREVPVVVDFWAEWCGPCRTLGPLLEGEVDALGGRAVLVKVDTDRSPELSARYRIRSIPAVMAFQGGEVVDGFVGAQPAAVVREFLARLAPSPLRLALERARAARSAHDLPAAEREARAALEGAAAASDRALESTSALLLASILVESGRPGEIEPVLARIDPRAPESDDAETLRRLAELSAEAAAYGGEERARAALCTSADDLEARYALAAALASSGRIPEALEELIAIVGRSRKFREDIGRRTMLLLFGVLPADSDVVREYRRRLQILT